MSVRVGTIEDLEGVLRLDREAEEAPHWAAREYEAALAGGGGGAVERRVWVWESGGEMLGFCVGALVEVSGFAGCAEGEIENVVVAAEARRRGVGRALCQALMDWLEARYAAAIRLEVRVSNVAAISLYEELGFTETGRRTFYYRNPLEDAFAMCRQTRTGIQP